MTIVREDQGLALQLYRAMRLIATFQEEAEAAAARGEFQGGYSNSRGEEAVSAGVCLAMEACDVLYPGLHGIGDLVANGIRDITKNYNKGKTINIINQKLGYMVRGGDPDAIDSIVPMAYGNLALDLILEGIHGRIVVLKNGRYDNLPVEVVTATKKVVDVERFYSTDRLRPIYERFEMAPLFIMTGD